MVKRMQKKPNRFTTVGLLYTLFNVLNLLILFAESGKPQQAAAQEEKSCGFRHRGCSSFADQVIIATFVCIFCEELCSWSKEA